jgi:hypothetical protein
LSRSCGQSADVDLLYTRVQRKIAGLEKGVDIEAGDLVGDTMVLFGSKGFEIPFAFDSPLWWVSLAVVEMQPVAVPRPDHIPLGRNRE